jgi:hypothetical protein
MKATLEFSLPEEAEDLRLMMEADKAWQALCEMDQDLRRIYKHGPQDGDPKTVEALCEKLRTVYTIPTLNILNK